MWIEAMRVAYVDTDLSIVLELGSDVDVTMNVDDANETIKTLQKAVALHAKMAEQGQSIGPKEFF